MKQVTDIFHSWGQRVEAMPERFRSIGGSSKWMIPGHGTWVIDCSAIPGVRFIPGKAETITTDCEIRLTEEHLCLLVEGKLNPAEAFRNGTLELAGNLDTVIRLNLLFAELVPSLHSTA